ncbi:MAG: aminotransferase class III-fold pyridoxal phosphate-dependent enzyme [Proteobacteria bacterium]|nr:aminotransferase class III-fold pyridoxal phosphate-dependent enzyme [Pseudomonadota bacterium]
MPLSNAQMRDVQSVLHPYTNLVKFRQTGPLIFDRGKGVHLYDEQGKDYIEAMSGLWCTALGWGETVLAEVAAEQMKKFAYGHLFAGKSHEPAIALAEKLKEVAPFPVGKVFFANSGSEANDTQIKLAWYAANARGTPQKKKIISRTKAYHGVTLASASLTGLPNNHRSFNLPFEFVRFTECPHYYRSAAAGESEAQYSQRLAGLLDELIQAEGPDTIAAMIAEPVLGAGGVILPPKGYFEAIMKVLDSYGIPMIDDEVITGFGRTGNWFGCETYKFTPDSMTIAKALSSAYLPISAVLLSPELSEIVEQESGKIGTFGHGFTYGGHPVPCAVALKTIELYQERDIVGHVRQVAPAFEKRIAKYIDHPLVGEVQSVGLLGGIELVADKQARIPFEVARAVAATIVGFAQEEGVILRPLMGDRIAFCPPLVITENEIDELFARFDRAMARGLDWAMKEGHLSLPR